MIAMVITIVSVGNIIGNIIGIGSGIGSGIVAATA